MDLLEIGHFLLLALSALGTPRIRIDSTPAPGLGPESGVGRLDPSDVLRMDDSHVVLYTKVTHEHALYPAPFGGEIWWAVSEDRGQHWTEKGRVLGAGSEGREDSGGVFDPTVVLSPDRTPYLFYAGVGPRFNLRFERLGRAEPTRVFVARLEFDAEQQTLRATRLGSSTGNLVPSAPLEGAFDSLRVRPSVALERNGLTYLYYLGLALREGASKSSIGMSVASLPGDTLRRAHEGRPVLPFAGEALLGHHKGGIFALFSGAHRGLWWAADGEHFAPLEVSLRGRLNSPGVFREGLAGGLDSDHEVWGLHVARNFPDPYLERFALRIEGELPDPVPASVPIPGGHMDASWATGSSWMDQHTRTRLATQLARPHFVFLGDDLVEGFGGHEDSSSSAGQAAWDGLFAERRAANLGLRGDTTANVIWRVDHGALPKDPLLPVSGLKAIFLQLGAQQLGQTSAHDISAGIQALIERLLARHPAARIVLNSIPRTPAMSSEQAATLVELNRSLASLARQPRVQTLELSLLFGADQRERFDKTGSGLSAAGYAAWAAAIEPVLREIERQTPEDAAAHLKRSR